MNSVAAERFVSGHRLDVARWLEKEEGIGDSRTEGLGFLQRQMLGDISGILCSEGEENVYHLENPQVAVTMKGSHASLPHFFFF